MSSSLHNDIVNRVMKTWEHLRPSFAPLPKVRKADYLVKMNLPPLLGRRDAAYDRAREFINQDIFEMDELGRYRIYCAIRELFRTAANDTDAILLTLASPDTESREKKMLHLMWMMHNIADSLAGLTKLEDSFFYDENSPVHELDMAPNDSVVARDEKIISEAEIGIVNQMRSYIERSLPRVERYRSYTNKSFSTSNASRYQKSYSAYHLLFGKLSQENPT